MNCLAQCNNTRSNKSTSQSARYVHSIYSSNGIAGITTIAQASLKSFNDVFMH